tara:strand:- start:52642 stop:53487 length:846 start_codon:yes stop_codon:yes gene_type:complete
VKNILALPFLVILNIPFFAAAGIINLGTADSYIFAAANNEQWGGSLLLGSEAHIFGSVAASNTLELGAGVIVDGDACSGTTNDWGATVAGATGSCSNFTQLANDINGAAAQALTFSGANLGNLSGSSEILGNGFQSFLINDLLLAGGDTLTVTGGVDDYFVFNVFGGAKLGSGANILLQGGVAAENVIFNFVSNPSSQSFELGGANISGTFLSSGRSFVIGDGATLNNSRFYSTQSIIANVQDVRFQSNTVTQVTVPEPATFAFFVLGVLGLTMSSRKRQS